MWPVKMVEHASPKGLMIIIASVPKVSLFDFLYKFVPRENDVDPYLTIEMPYILRYGWFII